jgi:hypothetical protein
LAAEHDGTEEEEVTVEVEVEVVGLVLEEDLVLDGAGEPPPPYTAGPGMV